MRISNHRLSRALNRGFNTVQAAGVPWLHWRRSIFGDSGSLVPVHSPSGIETEVAALQPLWRPQSLATLLRAGPSYPFLSRWIREPSGPIPPAEDQWCGHGDERWFFINGVCTDRRIAKVNAKALSRMFRRRLTTLFSPTDGFAFDLAKSALGKGWTITNSAACNFAPFVDALVDPDVRRVVLISHSEGTIVAAVLLKALEELLRMPCVESGAGAEPFSPERLVAREIAGTHGAAQAPPAKAAADSARKLVPSDIGKLELYCFANCSTSMAPFVTLGTPARQVPWIESYGNEYDVVAKLGVLAPPHGVGSARIGGDRYRRDGAWGHLLNAHYLIPMLNDLAGKTPPSKELKPFHDNLRRRPRLWDYIDGNGPTSFP